MPTAPLPDGAELMEPPLIYRVWWQQVESCAGLEGSFRSVVWYRVRQTSDLGFEHKGRPVVGLWSPRGNRILLSEHVLDRPLVVRHEMLHAVLRTGAHPASYFRERCRNWVEVGG